jgi:hypothetical protein
MPERIANSVPSCKQDTVTILTCTGGNFAAKTHRQAADGSLITDSFNAGTYFDHQVKAFDDLYGLFKIINEAAADPRKLAIRGRLREDAPQRTPPLGRSSPLPTAQSCRTLLQQTQTLQAGCNPIR